MAYPELFKTKKAAEHEIAPNKADLTQVIENKENPQTANNNINICKLGVTLKINGLADSWHSGAFRRFSAGGWAPRPSRFGFSTKRHRRLDITLARHYGAAHIDEIEFRGHAAEALQRARAADEARGRCPSLSPLTDAERKALDPRTPEGQTAIIREHFAMSPRLTVLPDGTEVWRNQQGTVIPRPIDAWPVPKQKPTRGNLFHARNPRLAQLRDNGVVTWHDRTGAEVPGPAGDLDATGDDVLAEHAAAVAAMSDDELLTIFARGADTAPDDKRAALAAGLRAYAARSSQHAAALFMSGRRRTFAPAKSAAAA